MLPVFQLCGSGQDFQSAFVRRKQSAQQRGIETLEIFHYVSQLESRLQIEKARNISQRTRKIQEHGGFTRNSRQLHSQVHGLQNAWPVAGNLDWTPFSRSRLRYEQKDEAWPAAGQRQNRTARFR